MMTDTSYTIFLIVGLFSILLGALIVLLPRKLTAWEEKLLCKLRLISKSKLTRPVKAEKFIQERLLGCLLLVFGIATIYFSLGGGVKMVTFEQLPSVSQDSLPADGLGIISAGYGTGDRWIDVSTQLREKIRANNISIKASNDIFGDPVFGKSKTLRVEYALDAELKTAEVQEGQWLHIPSDTEQHPEVQAVTTREQLLALVKLCPAEIGFFGRNLSTGQTIEYRPDQPACLASIVKIFVLLEVMRQADQGTLELSEPVTIERQDKKEICTISEALDKMIGVSDNEATDTLAARVGYERVNALPGELGIAGLSEKILPEPGVFGKVLDKRVFGKTRLCSIDNLLPQHGSARSIAHYFELLNAGKLINESISKQVLDVFDRNPKNFAPDATPESFESGGKGGSCAWILPGRPAYNMIGWGLLVRNEETAICFCLWCEWFPEETSEDLKRKWCFAISDSIVNILLTNESAHIQKQRLSQPSVPGERDK